MYTLFEVAFGAQRPEPASMGVAIVHDRRANGLTPVFGITKTPWRTDAAPEVIRAAAARQVTRVDLGANRLDKRAVEIVMKRIEQGRSLAHDTCGLLAETPPPQPGQPPEDARTAEQRDACRRYAASKCPQLVHYHDEQTPAAMPR
jgi:hypothetical protein